MNSAVISRSPFAPSRILLPLIVVAVVLAIGVLPIFRSAKSGSVQSSGQLTGDKRKRNDLFNAGIVAYRDGDFSGARSKFYEAQSLVKADFQSWAMLGRVYRLGGNAESARFWLKRTIEGVPGSGSSTQKDLGVLYEYLQLSVRAKDDEAIGRTRVRIVQAGRRSNGREEAFSDSPRGDTELRASVALVMAIYFEDVSNSIYFMADESRELRDPEPFLREALELLPNWEYSNYAYGRFLASYRATERHARIEARSLLTKARDRSTGNLRSEAERWLRDLDRFRD